MTKVRQVNTIVSISSVRDLIPYGLQGAYLVLLHAVSSKAAFRRIHNKVIPKWARLFREDVKVLLSYWTDAQWKRRSKGLRISDEKILEAFQAALEVPGAVRKYRTATPYYAHRVLPEYSEYVPQDPDDVIEELYRFHKGRLRRYEIENRGVNRLVYVSGDDVFIDWCGLAFDVVVFERWRVESGAEVTYWELYLTGCSSDLSIEVVRELNRLAPRGQVRRDPEYRNCSLFYRTEGSYLQQGITWDAREGVYMTQDNYEAALTAELKALGIHPDSMYRARRY